MSYASPAVLPPPAPSAGVILVPLGANSRIQFVDASGNVLGAVLYFNADDGKIKVNLGELNPDAVGQYIHLEADNRIVVNRIG